MDGSSRGRLIGACALILLSGVAAVDPAFAQQDDFTVEHPPSWNAEALPVRLAQAEAPDDAGESGPRTDFRPGQFVASPPARELEASDAAVEGDGFSATYADADVRLVVNQILGGYLGIDYTIAPDVSGVVTMRVSEVRTRQQALDTLRAALNPLGITVVERGDFIAIVRGAGDGLTGAVAVIAPGEPAPAGVGVAVLTPRYVAPSELAGLIAPFAPPSTIALTDDERRFIILRGEGAIITSASEAIALFDVDWFAQISTGIFPLDHVSPDELAGELGLVLGPAAEEIELVPLDRLSTLIVLARSPDALRVARAWIEQLDIGPVRITSEDGLLIYDARYADAEKLAASVGQLMGASGVGAAPVASSSVGAFDNAQSSVGQPAFGEQATSFGFGQSGVSQMSGQSTAGAFASGGAGLVIAADRDQNAVIARGEAAEIAEVRALLEALDRPRAQVLIEATIVEVTLDDELRYGVNWGGIEDERLRFVFSDASDGAVVSRFPGFSVSYVNVDVQAALNLLSSITEIEVLSRPSVIALNNEQAALQIGDQVPIVTQSAVSVIDPDAPIVNQTTYRDTGVILSVVPHVRAGGIVEIEIAQEVSDVARTTTSGIDSPTITQRRIESRLVVPSGGSVALGGLISSSRTSSETGIPVLRRAPLIGRLFRTNSEFVDRTELIIFLTPRVLATPGEAVDASAEMRAAMVRLEAMLAPAP